MAHDTMVLCVTVSQLMYGGNGDIRGCVTIDNSCLPTNSHRMSNGLLHQLPGTL